VIDIDAIITFFHEGTSSTKFYYGVVLIIVIGLFTVVYRPAIQHVFIILFITLVALFYAVPEIKTGESKNMSSYKKLNDIYEGSDLYHSKNSLLKVENKAYLHENIDIVNLMWELKYNFRGHSINSQLYNSILYSVNNLLKMNHLASKQVCGPAFIPNILDNYTLSDEPVLDTVCKTRVHNLSAVYQEAQKQKKIALNYIHSLIINTETTAETHAIHHNLYKRAKLLFERVIDQIYSQLPKVLTKQQIEVLCTDYESTQPISHYEDNFTSFEIN
jgi:hypothetical protein